MSDATTAHAGRRYAALRIACSVEHDAGHTARLMTCSSYYLCDATQRHDVQLRQRLLSWLDASGIRIKKLRYEDMHLCAEETFGAALRPAAMNTIARYATTGGTPIRRAAN